MRRWEEFLDDLSAFLSLSDVQSDRPLFLFAHSHGALVLASAIIRGIPVAAHAAGCIMISPFFRNKVPVPWHKLLIARCANPIVPWLCVGSGLSETWMSSDPAMQSESAADTLITRFATPRWYLETIAAQQRALAGAAQFRLALLICIGDVDPVADPKGGEEFFHHSASPDKTLKIYPNHLHELLRESQREKIFAEVLSWIQSRIRS